MHIHWNNWLKRALLWFGFWMAVCLFFASRTFFSQSTMMGGGNASFWLVFKENVSQWYTWGVLSLGVIALDGWLAGRRTLWQRLAIHLPLGIVVTALALMLMDFNDGWLFDPPASGASRRPRWAFGGWRTMLGGALQWNYLVYWLIVGGWMAWSYHREALARQLEAAQLQQSLTAARLLNLKAQLHPHFLFNALNTISAFVETDARAARQMIEHLGDLLRVSLEHAETQETTLAAELQTLEHYLAIQRVRFEDRLHIESKIAPETQAALLPSLLLQPLVENVIQHAVAQETRAVTLTIQAEKADQQLCLRISDDGPGLANGWQAGIGLTNTRQRLAQLYPTSHEFTLKNGAAGAIVEIALPFRT